MDRLSDGYLVRTNESLYSVQSMANIRIRLIFDSSNTLVNRLGPIGQCEKSMEALLRLFYEKVATPDMIRPDLQLVGTQSA